MILHFQNSELRIIARPQPASSLMPKPRELLNMTTLVINQVPMGVVIGELTDAVYPHLARTAPMQAPGH